MWYLGLRWCNGDAGLSDTGRSGPVDPHITSTDRTSSARTGVLHVPGIRTQPVKGGDLFAALLIPDRGDHVPVTDNRIRARQCGSAEVPPFGIEHMV